MATDQPSGRDDHDPSGRDQHHQDRNAEQGQQHSPDHGNRPGQARAPAETRSRSEYAADVRGAGWGDQPASQEPDRPHSTPARPDSGAGRDSSHRTAGGEQRSEKPPGNSQEQPGDRGTTQHGTSGDVGRAEHDDRAGAERDPQRDQLPAASPGPAADSGLTGPQNHTHPQDKGTNEGIDGPAGYQANADPEESDGHQGAGDAAGRHSPERPGVSAGTAQDEVAPRHEDPDSSTGADAVAPVPGPLAAEHDGSAADPVRPEAPGRNDDEARSVDVGSDSSPAADGTGESSAADGTGDEAPGAVQADRHQVRGQLEHVDGGRAPETPDPRQPEALPRAEKVTVDGKVIEVTHNRADGIWVEGLPGETPHRIGDVLASPHEDKRARGDRLFRKAVENADDLLDSVEKNINLSHDALQRPPTHAEVPVSVPSSGHEVPHHEIDAGSAATAGLTVGVLCWAAAEWISRKLKGLDDAGHR
jgi:hypothetical protein